MGGLAFSSGADALHTPRMPPRVYHHMRDKCHAALQELFVHVATPVEGPAKQDHGDIDILVAIAKKPTSDKDGSQSTASLLATIQQALHSHRAITNGPSVNLAIPWPSKIPDEAKGNEAPQDIIEEEVTEDANSKPRFIQVDVLICDSIEQMQWALFKHAHGDLWNILGSIIRPFGLTADEVGLFIRIPEIEHHNRRLAKVFLTNNPKEVLQLIGLEEIGYWVKPFATVEDLFEYVASCKLFWVKPAAMEGENGDGVDEGGNRTAEVTDNAGQEVGEEGKKKLKSNDRRRMAQRPVFQKWIDEFIPQCRAQGRFINTDQEKTKGKVRDSIREQAFARFPGVKQEYETRLAEWLKEKSKEEAWTSAIKGAVPEDLDPSRRGNVVNALKKIILKDDDSFGITPEHPLKTPDGFYLVDDIRRWVGEHWQEVSEIAWEKNMERALKRKAED